MDRSLDEIIAEQPRGHGQRRQPRGRYHNSNRTRDTVKKTPRVDEADLDRDWVHDKFEDDRESHSFRRGGRPSSDRRSHAREEASGAKLRVDNLHYDLTKDDLEDLFNRMGPVTQVALRYDRAGRSEGIAFVTYKYIEDAEAAIREFDGANAKGQPIRLTLLPPPRRLADYIEPPRRSLFDRVERPRNRARHDRSLSPMDEDDDEGGRSSGRRERRGRASKGGVDRYVPPGARDRDRSPPRQRRQRRRGDGGGERRERGGKQGTAARPRKTQEELDQEMEDYWNTTSNDPVAATGALPAQESAAAAAAAAPGEAYPAQTIAPQEAGAGEQFDDIDMIE